MVSDTFSSFSELAGSRISSSQDIERVCKMLDGLACSDLFTLLTTLSHTRSQDIAPNSFLDGNRFHSPSRVSQRDLHWIDGLIMDEVNSVDFVELSPLQPFGINRVLANTNQKNIVSALRRSEVNADATTALFRVAFERYMDSGVGSESIRVASNTRTVRAQTFEEDTGFLPHFKVFGEVTVGRQSSNFGAKEVESLIDHLGTEVDILDRIAQNERSNMQDLQISIGNLAFLDTLSKQGRIDIAEARRHTINPNYSLIDSNQLDIPEYVLLDSPDLTSTLYDLGFKSGIKITEKLRSVIESARPDLIPRVKLHLGRIAGTGYYRHLCYKLIASNDQGIVIPVADGGTTDWATKVTQNKQLYTVTSGIGTELVGQYLIN